MYFYKNMDIIKIQNFIDLCGIVCEIKEFIGVNLNVDVIFIMVDNNIF